MAKENLKTFIFLFLFIFLLFSVCWPKINLVQEWQKKKRIEVEILRWETALEKYPGYRDAHLTLAVLNWKINQSEKASEHLQKAKALDPNFAITKEVEKIIQE